MNRRTIGGIAVLAAATLAIGGCGSSEDRDRTAAGTGAAAPVRTAAASAPTDWPAARVDLGNGRTVDFAAGERPRFVYFSFGADVYIDAIEAGARAAADRHGVELDVLAAGADPVRQVRQMQDAMQSGRYAGGIVTPVVQSQLCDLTTEQMPARGMMIVNTNAPFCGREQRTGDEVWAPGTLAYVGGTQLLPALTSFAEEVRAENPGPQKVIVLAGPEGNSQSDNVVKAFEDVAERDPDFEVVAAVHTNFQTADALRKMQDALQANPDTTIVATIFSLLTKGAVVAAQQAGKRGEIRIYDVGADSTVLPMIESGDVAMTFPYYPRTMGETAMETLVAARLGRPFERVHLNDGHAPEELREQGDELLFVTRDNLDAWRSSGLSEY